jgi:DNA-directed RNA polymerase specialized sigma24 family protein
MSDFQNYARERAEVVARKLAPVPGATDVLGGDREDYCSALTLKLLEHQEELDDLDFSDLRQRRWVNLLLRNQAIDYQRRRARARRAVLAPGCWDGPARDAERDIEEEVERRELLRRLRASLSASDWSFLLDYVECGSAHELWEASGEQCTERAYRRRVCKLLNYCRKIIQQFM